jgi:hypothetical protein
MRHLTGVKNPVSQENCEELVIHCNNMANNPKTYTGNFPQKINMWDICLNMGKTGKFGDIQRSVLT